MINNQVSTFSFKSTLCKLKQEILKYSVLGNHKIKSTHMKPLIILFLLQIISVFSLYAQRNELKNEVNINVFSIDYWSDNTAFHRSYFTGMGFTYHAEKFNLRSSVKYQNYSYGPLDPLDMEYHGNISLFSLSAGIEKNLFKGRFKIYPAADLIFTRIYDEYSGYGDWPPYYYSGIIKENILGMSLNAGIHYQVTKHISCSAETGIVYGVDLHNKVERGYFNFLQSNLNIHF